MDVGMEEDPVVAVLKGGILVVMGFGMGFALAILAT